VQVLFSFTVDWVVDEAPLLIKKEVTTGRLDTVVRRMV
jgi:hypothetical protein